MESHGGKKESPPRGRDGPGPGAGSGSPSLERELLDLVLHGKRWWLTPILIVLALMAIFALLAGTAPVAPFIYSRF